MSDAERVGATNVVLNFDKITSLAGKIFELLCRKSKCRNDRVQVLNEYWAVRLVALTYE